MPNNVFCTQIVWYFHYSFIGCCNIQQFQSQKCQSFVKNKTEKYILVRLFFLSLEQFAKANFANSENWIDYPIDPNWNDCMVVLCIIVHCCILLCHYTRIFQNACIINSFQRETFVRFVVGFLQMLSFIVNVCQVIYSKCWCCIIYNIHDHVCVSIYLISNQYTQF